MDKNYDIFEHLMKLKLMKSFRMFYSSHKEGVLYLFFGALTTFLNVACFAVLISWYGVYPLASNIIAFIVGVIFAYVTNRIWVFESHTSGIKAIFVEMAYFFGGRVATLFLEEFLLWIGIDKLGIKSMIVKVVATILVIIANYIISKWFVFQKVK